MTRARDNASIFAADGSLNISTSVNLDDNEKALFGTSDDLQIYHDGSHSVVLDNGTGGLKLQGSTFVAMQSPTGENMVLGYTNGEVQLRYDNLAKLATTSSGIDVTGSIEVGDGHTIGDDANNNLTLTSSTGENIKFDTAGGTTMFFESGSEVARISSGRLGLGTTSPGTLLHLHETGTSDSNSDTFRITTTAGGGFAIGLQDQTQANPVWWLRTFGGESIAIGQAYNEYVRFDGLNERVGIGTTSPSTYLDIEGANARIDINETSTGAPQIQFQVNGTEKATIQAGSGGTLQLSADLDQRFSVAGTERMRIESSGYFGFNTTPITDFGYAFKHSKDITGTTAGQVGLHVDVDLSGSIRSSGDHSLYASYIDADFATTGGNVGDNEQIIYGQRIDVDYSTNDVNDAYGQMITIDNNGSNTNTTLQFGLHVSSIADNAAGDISSLYGARFDAFTDNNSGVEVVHDAYGIMAKVYNSGDGGKFNGTVNAGYFELEFANLSTASHETELVKENAYVVRAEFDNNTSNAAIMDGTAALFYGNYAGTFPSGTNYGIYLPDTGISNVISGSLSKGSGSFRIPHPLPALNDTKDLVHSFVEGPQADNLYRGKVVLSAGSATVDIDSAAGMTDGTFVLLNRDVQCFTTNETGWTAIKGSVTGNQLSIIAQDSACTDTISWMVIGERQDQHMYDTQWTDSDGRVIVEPDKLIPPHLEYLDSDEV